VDVVIIESHINTLPSFDNYVHTSSLRQVLEGESHL